MLATFFSTLMAVALAVDVRGKIPYTSSSHHRQMNAQAVLLLLIVYLLEKNRVALRTGTKWLHGKHTKTLSMSMFSASWKFTLTSAICESQGDFRTTILTICCHKDT